MFSYIYVASSSEISAYLSTNIIKRTLGNLDDTQDNTGQDDITQHSQDQGPISMSQRLATRARIMSARGKLNK